MTRYRPLLAAIATVTVLSLANTGLGGQTVQQQEAAVEAAALLEELGELQRAEEAFIVAARMAADATLTARALEGIRRVRLRGQPSRYERAWAAFESGSVAAGKVLAVVIIAFWVLLGLVFSRRTRQTIRVTPFVAESDARARELLFWVAYARASLRSVPRVPGTVLMAVSDLPAMDLPGLATDVPELENASLA